MPAASRWTAELERARTLQERLRSRVETRDRLTPPRRVAGADVSYARGDRRLWAVVVVLDAETLETLEQAGVAMEATFPYLPGYLSFREAPAVLEAFARLERRPDVLMVDGHGLAHPRAFGLACHLGVSLDVPTIGVAKSVLVGAVTGPGPTRGAHAPMIHRGRVVGSALRTRERVKPVYVSVGHRVGLATARRLALRFARRYRLPEPTRQAHLAVNRLRRGDGS